MSDAFSSRRSEEPDDPNAFTSTFDRFYTRTARVYSWAVHAAPFWRAWLGQTVPHLRGPRILEVSSGTGWLLGQYAAEYETYAIDLNAEMVRVAARAMRRAGIEVRFCRGDVVALPFRSGQFDTIVNTMAFTGYPDGLAAMAELSRVLAPRGRIVMVDVAYPSDMNAIGTALTRLWQRAGDIIRDMPALFREFGFKIVEKEIGGRGSVHLYVADRNPD